MFIKLKAPILVALPNTGAIHAIENEVYLHVNRIGYAIFRKTDREMREPRRYGNFREKIPIGTPCLEIQAEGDITDIPLGAAGRYLIVFPEDQRTEWQRLYRAFERLAVEK